MEKIAAQSPEAFQSKNAQKGSRALFLKKMRSE